MTDAVLSGYLWLVVVGSFAAFMYGFGTGSNDVANAFGTSVGAKTLTLRQAVLIAAVFEFVGALVLGRVSTSVIAGGIADINAFYREPEIFAYGMVCAITVAGLWQILASYLELNVSSTHSIIGCIIGFALVYAGKDAVLWQVEDKASFPPIKGVVPIIISWFISPLLSSIAAGLLFITLRTLVLRRENSYNLSFWVLPPFVCLTFFVCIYFVFTKGAKKTLAENSPDADWTDSKSAWVSIVIAAGVAILSALIAIPLLKRRAANKFNEDGTVKEVAAKDPEAGAKVALELDNSEGSDTAPKGFGAMVSKSARQLGRALSHGTNVDIHAVVEEDEVIAAIHKNAEVFDPKTEYAFSYLQVFSAICVVFAHGAGEVGYMAGPLTAIWDAYNTGKVNSKVTAPVWIIIISAAGLVVGLATYGYKVTRAMGVRMAKLSPTRGFCAELSTALIIMIASQYGLPTSSSQVITGAIIGVGLMEGKLGVNWKFLAVQFGSWVGTLFISGLCTAALFAQGVYAPGKLAGESVMFYEDTVAGVTQAMLNSYTGSLNSFRDAAAANVIPRLTTATIDSWNKSLSTMSATTKTMIAPKTGTADPGTLVGYLNTALSLYQSDSVLTVGQVNVFPKAVQCNSNVTADIQAGVKVACPAPKLLPSSVTSTWPPSA